MLALGNLANVANNQVVQNNECSEEDTVEKKKQKTLRSQAAIFKKSRYIMCQGKWENP